MLTIGIVALPDPADDGYSANTATFVDGARNLEGNFVGATIGDDKAKVECTWKFLETKIWADVLKQFNRKVGGKFVSSVTYFSQDTGDWETCDMYISDRSAGNAFIRDKRTGIPRGWQNCRLALIQV